MSEFSPIVWTEGMFLRPQHMQQQERYLHFQQANVNHKIKPLSWGVYSLTLDTGLLSLGQFRLETIDCIFPDNTLAILPEQNPLPEAVMISSEVTDQIVYLVLPINKTTGLNIAPSENNTLTRYRYQDHNIVDTSIGSDAVEVLQVAKLNCQLKLESEERAGYVSIAIARIVDVSNEGAIRLDKKFIPPCVVIDNITALSNSSREILGMIKQRADAIAARLTQAQGTGNSIVDFMMLQLLNKYQPVFEHLAKVPGITPEQLYQTLISFVGELATFTAPDKRSPQLPDYQHNNLSDIFNQCVMLLTQGLSTVLEQTAIELPLEKSKFGIFVSPLNDKTLLDRGEFILAIKANLTTDEIRKRLPAQIKIGAVEQIRELVNNQLPGIGLTHLTVAPRQVPYQVGYCYFQLNKVNNNHWENLSVSGGIAIHVSGKYPELDLALWAINNK